MANDENLKPFGSGKRTVSEERALQSKGGKNSGKTRSIKAKEKEEWMELLSEGIGEDELRIFNSVLERMQEQARKIIEKQEEDK